MVSAGSTIWGREEGRGDCSQRPKGPAVSGNAEVLLSGREPAFGN